MSVRLRLRVLEPALVLAVIVGLGVPGPWAAGLLTAAAAAWLALLAPRLAEAGAQRREAAVVALPLLAAVALVGSGLLRELNLTDPARRRAVVADQFERLWRGLEESAEQAVAAIGPDLEDSGGGGGAFETLAELAGRRRGLRHTVLLLDPDGAAVAWAGEGLLHEPERLPLPDAGAAFRAGFASVTLMAVRPVSPGPRPWRVVVGRSLPNRDLPVPEAALGPVRWTVLERDQEASPDLVTLDLAPGLRVALRDPAPGRTAAPWLQGRRGAAALVGLGLVTLGLLRLGGRRARGGNGAAASGAGPTVVLLGGLLALGLAGGLSAGTLVLLLVGAALALTGWRSRRRLWLPGPPALAGGLAAAVVVAVSATVQVLTPPADLGSRLTGPPGEMALRVALFLLAAGLLGLARKGADRATGESGDRVGWAAVTSLLLAAALPDFGLVAGPLVVAAGALSGMWAARQPRPLTLPAATLVCLLAALLAAVSWEATARETFKRYFKDRLLAATAPPVAGELERLRFRVEEHFEGLDLRALALQDLRAPDPQDLGFALWGGSPLSVRGALSALVVEPLEGEVSRFSFGLPLSEDGEVDWSPIRWPPFAVPALQRRLVAGEAWLGSGGRLWGRARFWMLPRPAFALAEERIENLAAGLLRGEPAVLEPDVGVLGPARYGLYTSDGAPVVAPWAELPVPVSSLRPGAAAAVATPSGPALAWGTAGPDGVRVLLLPRLGPVAALERAGTHAVGALLWIAGLALLAVLFRSSWRPLGTSISLALRSYSRRMVIVFSVLLLVPVLLLNAFVLRLLGEHLYREQEVSGRAAMESAQRVLGEYVLALEPGFGLDTVLDDALLVWLSRVVHHEVNLYWGSELRASSRSELFTAGLLPKRIPGEIYSRLALGGSELATRVNQAGDTAYLELYGPLRIPGVPVDRSRLFLSMPLLAQQELTAAEVASLRRRALVTTAALVLLLAAVGARLARSFTAPLMEVVRGTQRIAAGAESTEVTPSEQELATLVEAIDQMAVKIADARRKLMSEKELVDRMIDSINSGVVSLDRQHRVLMHNRVAQRLLGVAVGDRLGEVVGKRPELAAVGEFLGSPRRGPALHTVRLAGEEGEEREWTLVWVPLEGDGEPSALLVVEDVTEVLRGQRLEAWAEMARMIAHEIKNPLTPIRLSTEHMREVRAQNPQQFDVVFERCTANILEQVAELQQISSEFSAYSRLPQIEPRREDLAATVRKVVDGYRAGLPASKRLELAGAGEPVLVEFDARLLGRALRNLLENALRATVDGGRVEVALERTADRAAIRVSDDGPGIDPELLPRIFDPYFSTHDSGTGLGLPIARRIAEEHGGGIVAHNRPGGGLEVVLWLPAG